ncbi:MAG TPA: hypothetical protein VIK91_06575 [Nannocystis sp.]
MMLTVGIAVVAPLAPAQTLAARPLSAPSEPVEWCWGACSGDDEPDVEECYQEMTGSDTQDHRCDLVSGRACHELCTAAAVTASCLLDLGGGAAPRALARCGSERLDLCHAQCDRGGAGFCAVRKKKDPPAWGHCHDGKPGTGGGHSDKHDLNDTHAELDEECGERPGGGPSHPVPEEPPQEEPMPHEEPTPPEEPTPEEPRPHRPDPYQPPPDEGEDDGVIYVDLDLCYYRPDPIPG